MGVPAVVAVLVVALLSVGVASAAIRRSDIRQAAGEARAASLAGAAALDDGAVVQGGPPPSTPVTGQPTTTSTAAATTSTVARTTSTKPAAPATTTTKAAPSNGSAEQGPGSYGPRDKNSVTVPYQPGQTSWSGVSNGITLTVTMQPASPKAGDTIRFAMEATTGTPTCCQIHIWFGDGFGWPSGLSTDPCSAYDFGRRAEVAHTYNAHGRREFMFSAFANGCKGDGPLGTLYGSFDVAPGVSSAQGPSLPIVRFDRTVPLAGHENDPSYLTVVGQAIDSDGYITKMVLDWGDGSPLQTFSGDRGPCRPSLSGWPLESMAIFFTDPRVFHHYAASGTYRVTLTAYSTGCDGSMEQRGVGALTHRVP